MIISNLSTSTSLGGVWGCQETYTNRRVPKAWGGIAVTPVIPAIHPPVTDLSSTVWVPAVPGRW